MPAPAHDSGPPERPLCRTSDALASRRDCELLRSVIESIPDILFFKDSDGVYLGCNQPFASFVGQPQERIVGRSDLDLFPREVADSFRRYDATVREANAPRQNEEWVTYPDGRRVVVDTFKAPLRNTEGAVVGLLGVSRDVTTRRLAEDRLRTSEANFASLFTSLRDLLFIMDFQGRILRVNTMALDTLGYAEKELVGHSVLTVHAPEHHEAAARVFKNMLAGTQTHCDLPLLKKNGDWLPVDTQISFGKWNGEDAIFGISRDISERKSAEAAFGRLNQIQSQLMRLATDFVNVQVERQDEAIRQALASVGRLIGADRAYLFAYDAAGGLMHNTHEWCAEGIVPMIDELQNVPLDLFPEWVGAHRRGDIVNVPSVASLPPGSSLREILEPQGIQSLITLPLKHNSDCLGFVGFDAVRTLRVWRDEEIALLRVLAELFANFKSRKTSEQEIRRLSAAQGMLLDTMDAQVWYLTDEATYGLVNKAHAEFLGVPREAVQNQPRDLFVPSEAALQLRDLRKKAFAEGVPAKRQVWIPNSTGEPRLLALSVTPKTGADGRVEYVVCVAHDITELDRTRQRLETSERRYRGLIESQQDLIIREDMGGRFTFANEAFCRMFGKRPDELIGQRFQPTVHADDVAAVLALMSRLGEPPHRVRAEYRAHTVDGWRWLSWEAVGVLDADGQIVEVQGVGRDVTETRQLQEGLLKARDAAEAAARAKSLFLANMSHEIRTPLNAILGYAQILSRTCSNCPSEQRGMETILKSGEHLLDLLNSILNSVRTDAQDTHLDECAFDFHLLLEDICLMLRGGIRERPLTISVAWTPDVPQHLFADKAKIRQVLLNLVGNATKFTEAGSIRIEAERADAPPDGETPPSAGSKVQLAVRVTDTGCGISERFLPKLFEPFEQAEQRPQASMGVGLGLPISLRVARLLGGDITVQSEEGRGSAFRFTFWGRSCGDGAEPQPQPSAITGLAPDEGLRHVLVVDDDRANCEMLNDMLSAAGFDITLASSGQEALLQLERDTPFDIVLMDKRMPGMDGLEAIRRIRMSPGRSSLPVLLVTASGLSDEDSTARAVGANGCVFKPLRRAQLLQEIQRVTGLRFAREGAARTGAAHGQGLPALAALRASLARLPASLALMLEGAVQRGDIRTLRDALSEVERLSPALADHLRPLILNYDYDALRRLLLKNQENEAL